MNLLAAAGTAPGQLIAALALWALALYWLLPRPRGRSVALGTFAALAGGVVLGSWVVQSFGVPAPDAVGRILFWLFAVSAVVFATAFVVQRNPARGAIAFAFVIVSVCGLFLLLAAPFLMAATVIVYAGAIIVTFLFVLMLSHTRGPADENDRSREPLLGSLAAFAFLGLVLFALYQSGPAAAADTLLPAPPVTAGERAALLRAADRLEKMPTDASATEVAATARNVRADLWAAVGAPAAAAGDEGRPIPDRLAVLADARSKTVRSLAEKLRADAQKAFAAVENRLVADPNPGPQAVAQAKRQLVGLRVNVLQLAGYGELPARNVANLGYSLYTDHLLAVEMAGAVLLVATVGAIAIAGRRGAAA